MNYLARNRETYEEFVDAILRFGDRIGPDLQLCLVSQAAWFATVNHPGRFADHRIENIALAIGADLDRLVKRHRNLGSLPRLARTAARRHVLHVATEVAGIGGHTRTIQNWAELDRDSSHSLALTYQAHCAVPEWLRKAITRSGGQVFILPETAPPTVRALWLRAIARDADLVLSHHFTEDVIPIAAFATTDGPPVGIINQSDHVFWLGSSVADTVVNLRQIGRVLSEARRAVRHNTLIPIPLEEPPPALDRWTSRKQLGIADDRVMLLSVGRAEKYRPSSTHNFFATTGAILSAHPEAELHLVGVSEDQARPFLPESARFRCAGEVESPGAYRAAADIYLEGFPFGSQTAMLEAGLAGLAPVPVFAPLSRLLVTQDEAFDELLVPASTEEAYRETVAELVRSPRGRAELGAECARRVRACHIGSEWLDRLAKLYETFAGLPHAPKPIAPTLAAETPDDVGLGVFHAFNTDGGCLGDDLRYKLRRAAFESAFAAREANDYLGAWRVLRLAKRSWGDDGSLAKAARKLLPHWLLRRSFRRTRLPEPVVMN
ncbi:MAG: hypothetical protein L0241_20145 [Planctomycetia bacterium]|nr:hypothetical protein [Planctomycetia bacterium]